MRIAILVVTALLCAATLAAEEGGNRSEAIFCSERCDAGFETCMRHRTGKGTVDCPGTFVKCRDACEPPAARKAAYLARKLSCRDACQENFDACVRRDDGKHGETCNKNIMVCRNGCPEEVSPPEVASPPAAASAPIAATAPPAASAPVAPAMEIHPETGKVNPAPPSRAAVSAPEPARAVATPSRRDEVPVTTSVAATTDRATATVAAPATTEATTHETAAPSRPSAWSRAWCGLTGSCGSKHAPKAPLSCEDACGEAYDTCVGHEDPKRSGACATSSVRCRTGCADRKTNP